MEKWMFLLGVCFHLTSSQSASAQESQFNLDREIKYRQIELDKLTLLKEHQEIDSQAFMIDDWSQFAQKTEEIKKIQDRVNSLKKEIKELKEAKAKLSVKPENVPHDNK